MSRRWRLWTVAAGRTIRAWPKSENIFERRPARSSSGILLLRNAASRRLSQRLAFAERGEDGEFFGFDAAEIDGIVDAVHNEIDRLRIELGDGADVLFFALFGEGVAGKVGVVFFANGEEKIVDGIGEVEQANVRLQFEFERLCVGDREIFRCKAPAGTVVEGFDVGPFEASDVERERLLLPCPFRMRTQPGFHF